MDYGGQKIQEKSCKKFTFGIPWIPIHWRRCWSWSLLDGLEIYFPLWEEKKILQVVFNFPLRNLGFFKVVSFLVLYREYIDDIRKTIAICFIADASLPLDKEFLIAVGGRVGESQLPAWWRTHCHRELASLQLNKRRKTESSPRQQRQHLEAKENPMCCRRVWVGYWTRVLKILAYHPTICHAIG